jgi:hypothetical protein
MRNEHDLRSALCLLEDQTPDIAMVLQRVTEPMAPNEGRSQSRRARRPGRQLLTGLLAAAAVIAVTVVALILTRLPGTQVPVPPSSPLHEVPPYYVVPGPDHFTPLGKGRDRVTQDVLIKSTLTGKTLAIIRPPGSGGTLGVAGAAADDRTFLLVATSPTRSELYEYSRLYVARFDPVDRKATLTRLNIPAFRDGPNPGGVAGVVISPDGSEVAVAFENAKSAQIKIYSLPNGTVRTWKYTAPVSYPFSGLGGGNALTWSRNGLLAFDWSYARSASPVMPVPPQGMRLLNTSLSGGSLIADSAPFCLQLEFGGAYYGQYLTSDGKQVIVPVYSPVKIGRRPAKCATAAAGNGVLKSRPAIEEFSVSTGRATAILGQFSWGNRQTLLEQETLYWSNPSGSVLVVLGPAGPGPDAGQTLGVLSHGRFTPLPRARVVGYTAVAF